MKIEEILKDFEALLKKLRDLSGDQWDLHLRCCREKGEDPHLLQAHLYASQAAALCGDAKNFVHKVSGQMRALESKRQREESGE